MKKIFTLFAALMLLACGSFTAQAGIFTEKSGTWTTLPIIP